MPVEWTEISLRVILSVTSSVTSSHYLEMSTCALALVFFCSWIFLYSFFFFLAMDCCFCIMNKE